MQQGYLLSKKPELQLYPTEQSTMFILVIIILERIGQAPFTKKSIDYVLSTTKKHKNEWVTVKANVKEDFKIYMV